MSSSVSLLQQACVFLGSSIIAVPIAQRLGLGSVLGYLTAGAIIGPFALAWVGDDVSALMHFAEFGVVMMLFLIGLELRPSTLWKMRIPILGLGGTQVLLSTLIIASVAWLLVGNSKQALAMGLILSLSSTAIVLQMLNERHLVQTPQGSSTFSVLLFQDIAVIPIIALMPLLASSTHTTALEAEHVASGQHKVLGLIIIVGAMLAARKLLVSPLLRVIAKTKMRELFTAIALFLVCGIAMLMQSIGLSAALGTFLAGVILAESEYRHELEAELEPFKGLLLGLFFITVGASINFDLLRQELGNIVSIAIGLIALKAIAIFAISKAFKLPNYQSFFMAFILAQGSEFAFVLIAFAQQTQVLPSLISEMLMVAIALSMAISPLLFIAFEKWLTPRLLRAANQQQRAFDAIPTSKAKVMLVGYGRFGQMIGRLLTAHDYELTVLEQDPNQVEMVRKFGHVVFYGDASRLDLLESAGIANMQLLILASDGKEKTLEIFHNIKKHWPHIKIFTRAYDRGMAQELLSAGADYVIRETLASALDMGEHALVELGMTKQRAKRSRHIFQTHDEKILRELIGMWEKDFNKLVSESKRNAEQLREVMRIDIRDIEELQESSRDISPTLQARIDNTQP